MPDVEDPIPLDDEPTPEVLVDRVAQAAYVLMALFVISTSAGFALAFGVGFGLISLGLTSGLYGYLLGKE